MENSASWVVIDKKTGKALFETFTCELCQSINTSEYKVIPIMEYLQDLNRKIKI